MQFSITIKHDRKTYRYAVERILYTNRIEHFKVTALNKSIILESNRPLFRNKGLRYRRPGWSIIKGDIWNQAFLDKIKAAIYAYVESQS